MKNINHRISINLVLFLLMLCALAGCKQEQEKTPFVDNLRTVGNSVFVLTGDAQIDSIIKLHSDMPLDTNLALLYYDIAESFEDSDIKKAALCYLYMGEFCEMINWDKGRYMFAIGYAHVLIRQNHIDSAININLNAIELAKNNGDDYYYGRLAYSLGNAYLIKQWYEMAAIQYMEALADFEQRGDEERIMSVYSQLSLLYSDIEATDKAIEYGEKANAICPDDPYLLMSLAKAYASDMQNKKAIQYFKKAIEKGIEQDNIFVLGVVYYQMSEALLQEFDLVNAERYAKEALEIANTIGYGDVAAGSLSILGKVEQLRGNFEQAELLVKESLQIVTLLNNLQGQSFCYMVLSELAVAQKEFRESIQYWNQWSAVRREIAAEKTVRTAGDMEAKYETAKKESEIEKQRLIIKTQHRERIVLLLAISLSIAIIIMVLILLYFRNRRHKTLVEINTTKDMFFSIISHDLKNPSISQRDALQMLAKNAHNIDMKSMTESLNMLLETANEQVVLLCNLLNWAQIQTGRMHYNPAAFSLSAALRNDIALIKKMAEAKDIRFDVQIPDETIVTGDSAMISTVVRNLLSNAVKFTPSNGVVTLSVSEVETDSNPSLHNTLRRCRLRHCSPQQSTRITISDTGIGMNSEKLSALFRLGKTHSENGTSGEHGSGLGLIVCKEIIEKHKTKLHVESEPGKGSKFWFDLQCY